MGLGAAIAVAGKVDADLANATWVEVYERAGEPASYRLRFEIDIGQGDIPMLSDARLAPGSVLSILVSPGNKTQCLVKGPVHAQLAHIQHGGAGSFLEVRGGDTAITMDREAKSAAWSGGVDSDAVTSIVGKYGLSPDVDATPGQHPESKHVLVQRESDLQFVQRLARRNGCYFWITADGTGVETAHFKRPQLGGATAATIAINLASHHIEALDVRWDVERPTQVDGKQLDLNAKSLLDGSVTKSPLAALGDKTLDVITGDTRSMHLVATSDDAGDLKSRCEGALIEASWFIRATCQTSLDRLASVVRAHSVVEIQGAGKRHSGKYFVHGVRHTIDPAMHRMDLELVRNAWGG